MLIRSFLEANLNVLLAKTRLSLSLSFWPCTNTNWDPVQLLRAIYPSPSQFFFFLLFYFYYFYFSSFFKLDGWDLKLLFHPYQLHQVQILGIMSKQIRIFVTKSQHFHILTFLTLFVHSLTWIFRFHLFWGKNHQKLTKRRNVDRSCKVLY